MYNFYTGDTAGRPKSREDGVLGWDCFCPFLLYPIILRYCYDRSVCGCECPDDGKEPMDWATFTIVAYIKRCLGMELLVIRRT